MIAPDWLVVAEGELARGVLELPGESHHPAILRYHQATTLRATEDEVPWCASFVGWCLDQAGVEPTRSARARSYLDGWGTWLRYPAHGAVAVLGRGELPWPSPNVIDAPGHVGFVVGRAASDELLLLGGNQSDRVCVRPYAAARVLAFVWPA